MEKKFTGIPNIQFFSVIIAAIFIFSGCSSMGSWFSFSESKVKGFEPDEVKKFMATVKPAHGDTQGRYRLARHFQKLGRDEIAVEELTAVLKINPGHYNAYNALGVSYDRLKKFDLAADAYRAALKLNPDLDYVYNNLGYSNLLRGNLHEAALSFEQAILLNGQNKTYKNNLSLVRARLGKDQATPSSEQPALAGQKADVHPAGQDENLAHQDRIDGKSSHKHSEKNMYYAVQLGVYTNIENAERRLKKAIKQGYDCPYMIKVEKENHYKPYYRVRFGKFDHKQEAESIGEKILDDNGNPAFTVVENYPVTVFCTDPQNRCQDMEYKHALMEKKYTIEIANGNGVNLMARKVGRFLTHKGYYVNQLSNASNFNHDRTIVYYHPGFYGQARNLSRQIPGFQKNGKLVESKKIKKDIKILIGKDVIPYYEKFTTPSKNA